MQDQLQQRAKKFVEENFPQLLADLREIIAIPSVSGTPAPDAPFGVEVKRCFDAVLALGESFGLKSHNCDNRIGYLEVEGESEEYIATIAHCDVVPAGNGWDNDPFNMIEKDGYLIGRGVMDDKGPLLLTLYLAKFLKETGEKFPYTFRAIVGCDEETGMSDVDHFLSKHDEPKFCYTPDSNFPLIHGEKGIMEGNFISPVFTDGKILECHSGMASNVVPDEAYMLLKPSATILPEAEGISISKDKGNIKLVAKGRGAHASTPETGISAIHRLVSYVLANKLVSEAEHQYLTLVQLLVSDYTGKNLDIDRTDDIFSPLTIIGGMLNFKDQRLVQNFNIRYPKSITGAEIKANLERHAKAHAATLEVLTDAPTFYMDPNNKAVHICCNTYNEIFGKNEQPYTIGGGTYARHFKNAISFGPEHLDDVYPDFAGPIHGANEGAEIQRLKDALVVYIVSTYRLLTQL